MTQMKERALSLGTWAIVVLAIPLSILSLSNKADQDGSPSVAFILAILTAVSFGVALFWQFRWTGKAASSDPTDFLRAHVGTSMLRQWGSVLAVATIAFEVTGWTVFLIPAALALAGTLGAALFMVGFGVVFVALLDAALSALFAFGLAESSMWQVVLYANAILALLYFAVVFRAMRSLRRF